MRLKLFLLMFVSIFLLSFVSADSQTFQMKFIVPAPDITPPTFTNLRNFDHTVNTSFSEDFDATDAVGVECFGLNDTSIFNIDCSGTVTNAVVLDTLTIYYLNMSVNDSAGNTAYGEFYINVVAASSGGSASICLYRKFGFYNLRYMGLKSELCV